MLVETVILWYVEHASRVLAGQCLFFILVSSWAWRKRGRTHFFSEINVFLAAMVAFATMRDWAFAALSVSVWVHIALIAREILGRRNGNES